MELCYEIKTSCGQRMVEGTGVNAFIAYREDKPRGEWIVDHVATGLRIVGVKNEESARNVAESIADLIDWSKVTGQDNAPLPREAVVYIHKASGQHRVPKLGDAWPKPVAKKFRIDIDGSFTLSVDQLWPDGDWPDEPTEDDVLALIEKEGGANCIIAEWDLDVEARVTDIDKLTEKIKSLR